VNKALNKDNFNTEDTTQVKTKKPIKWPIVSIFGERKTSFLIESGNNNSLEKNSKEAQQRISIKKAR
jgi:hypothetical protein